MSRNLKHSYLTYQYTYLLLRSIIITKYIETHIGIPTDYLNIYMMILILIFSKISTYILKT